MQLLRKRLRNFKLSGIYRNLEERIDYAKEKSLSYPVFLGLSAKGETGTEGNKGFATI